jgi:DNA-binding response OmpR family regulator
MFMNNVNRVFTKNDIYSSIWDEPVMDENAIMVYINRLRQKIEDDPSHPRYIKNVRGMGYMFVV